MIKRDNSAKKKETPVWVINAQSESSDTYGPEVYDHEPTEKEQRAFIEETGEELDCDGCADYGSYVYLTITKTNLRK